MKRFFRHMIRENRVLSGLLGISPILLLSGRLVYALVFSAFLLLYFSLSAFSFWLIDRYLRDSLRLSAKLIMAATFISLADMLVGAFLPLVRADIGIMLPLTLAFLHWYIPVFPPQGKGEKLDLLGLYGSLSGFMLVFISLSAIRELLAYGRVSLDISPWVGQGSLGTPLLLFSTGFGLLFLLAYGKALFAKVAK